jgi:hypothetical protein
MPMHFPDRKAEDSQAYRRLRRGDPPDFLPDLEALDHISEVGARLERCEGEADV